MIPSGIRNQMVPSQDSKIPENIWYGVKRDRMRLQCINHIPMIDMSEANYVYSPNRILVFHKYIGGHALVELDCNRMPVKAFKTSPGYTIMRMKLVKPQDMYRIAYRTTEKIGDKKLPRCVTNIYTNDGTLLAPIPQNIKVESYTNMVIENVLVTLRGNYLNKNKTSKLIVGKAKTKEEQAPTYEEVKRLDPNINFQDYKYIYNV